MTACCSALSSATWNPLTHSPTGQGKLSIVPGRLVGTALACFENYGSDWVTPQRGTHMVPEWPWDAPLARPDSGTAHAHKWFRFHWESMWLDWAWHNSVGN